MRYLGGKSRHSGVISEIINRYTANGADYYEPFCGSCWVSVKVEANKKYLSDYSSELIALWIELQKGWVPPDNITEEEYNNIKNNPNAPKHLRAFVGFGCSFSGQYFSCYARHAPTIRKDGSIYIRNDAKNAKKELLKKIELLKDVNFSNKCFSDINPTNSVIYCDPPYINTTGYKGTVFNHDEFYSWARELSKNNVVIISEFTMPDDFDLIHSFERTSNLNNRAKSKTVTEKVFKIGSLS